MKKLIRRIAVGIGVSLMALLSLATLVLAVPASITNFVAVNVTSTSVSLLWIPATSSNSSVVRYSTTGYPATPADGTSAYSGVLHYVTVSGLTAGQRYYFSAWGYDGSDYSATAATTIVTTLAPIADNSTIPYSQPTLPAQVWQDPSITGWSIHPLDDVLDWFADPSYVRGGLGMPTANLVMLLVGITISGVSIGTYVKWRSFGTSWFIAFILSIIAVSTGVMQGTVIIFEIVIGLGVFAIDRSFQ